MLSVCRLLGITMSNLHICMYANFFLKFTILFKTFRVIYFMPVYCIRKYVCAFFYFRINGEYERRRVVRCSFRRRGQKSFSGSKMLTNIVVKRVLIANRVKKYSLLCFALPILLMGMDSIILKILP